MTQQSLHDTQSLLEVGDKNFAQNFTQIEPKWLPGTVVQVTGPLSYHVQLQNGSTVHRCVD